MKRREILRYTALLTGAAVVSPIALTLSSCKSDAALGNDYIPSFFSEEEFAMVKKVIDTIIPRTDSPSATEVGVHEMIDDMVAVVYPQEAKESYAAGSKMLLDHLKSMDKLDEMALSSIENQKDEIAEAFRSLKQQTVAYYLNTEKVGTEFLNYLPVPGEYQGCIELSEVGGKAWAI